MFFRRIPRKSWYEKTVERVFRDRKLCVEKLLSFGFVRVESGFLRRAALLDGQLCMELEIHADGSVHATVHDADGKNIRTLEGLLGPGGELADIQQAFIDEAAIQCGFCTPGFIMTAVEILESGKAYSDDELRKLLSGHLCRCTGYENILRAVKKTMLRRLERDGKGCGSI